MFGVNVHAHVFEDGEGLRQYKRFVKAVDHEMHVPRLAALWLVKFDSSRQVVGKHLLDPADIAACFTRRDIYLVTEGERIAILTMQARPIVDTTGLTEFGAQAVGPCDHHLGDHLLNGMNAYARSIAGWRVHDNMHAGQRRV